MQQPRQSEKTKPPKREKITTFANLMGGISAGVAQTGIGYPFDVIKFRLQNRIKAFPLPLRHYYRGSLYPLLGAISYNGVTFSIYKLSLERTKNTVLSGAIAGAIITPLVFIQDVGKIKKNLGQQKRLSIKNFVGTGRSKGLSMAFLRETGAMAAYFSSYHKCKEYFSPLLSGALAGLINWTLTYPIDVLRNRQIAQQCSIREAYQQGKLWKGYSFCAMRAIIVNAAIFYTYEETVKIFN